MIVFNILLIPYVAIRFPRELRGYLRQIRQHLVGGFTGRHNR